MKALESKAGLKIATIYLLLVLAALAFTVLELKKSAFAGVYLVILTMPWSVIEVALLDSLHIQDSVSIFIKLVISIMEAFLNAGILYFIGAMIEKTKIENPDKWTQL